MMHHRNLLPFASPISRRASISEFATKKLGVDGDSLMESVIYQHSAQLLGDSKLFERLESLFIGEILSIKRIIPSITVIFSGMVPNCFFKYIKSQRDHKMQQIKKAGELKDNGYFNQAAKVFQENFKPPFQLISGIIDALKKISVPSMVAPYSSLDELCFLQRRGDVDAIFCDNCEIFLSRPKLTIHRIDPSFTAIIVDFEKLLGYYGVSEDQLIYALFAIGSSSSEKVVPIGLVKSIKLAKESDSPRALCRKIRDSGYDISKEVEDSFVISICSFQKPKVYDPAAEIIVEINGPKFECSTILPHDQIIKLVSGQVDPGSLQGVDMNQNEPEDADGALVKPFENNSISLQQENAHNPAQSVTDSTNLPAQKAQDQINSEMPATEAQSSPQSIAQSRIEPFIGASSPPLKKQKKKSPSRKHEKDPHMRMITDFFK